MNSIQKTFLVFSLILAANAQADVSFTVRADRNRISEDESVSLQFEVSSEENLGSVGAPEYEAPDFELSNTFQSSRTEGTYVNGHFGMKSVQQIHLIFRPKKQGTFRFTKLGIEIEGKKYSAPDLVIAVDAGGSGTAPPSGYGGHGGLRGAGKKREQLAFFVRAENSKDRVYTGEQVIVSYYLYRSTRLYTAVAKQFPTLSGFLKEDLDVPIMGKQLQWERVTLDGAAYERALLARYAVYPLRDGKLTIDSLTMEAQYGGTRMPSMPGFGDDDDFFNQFFQQVTPRIGTQKSDPLTIEVIPIPSLQRPANFSGGVGDFEIISAVDKTEVKAGEAVSLTIQVEGRGSVSAIELPKLTWPSGVDLFDSKGRSKPGQGGIGNKTFEFVLIPRQEGEVVLPSIELSFFDPAKKAFVTKKTDPIKIRVLPGTGGGISIPAGPNGNRSLDAPSDSTPSGTDAGDELLRKLTSIGKKLLPVIAGVMGAIVLIVFLVVFISRFKSYRAKMKATRLPEIHFGKIRKKMNSLPKNCTKEEAVALAVSVENTVVGALERKFKITLRGESRERWREVLGDQADVPSEIWSSIEGILHLADTIRYSGNFNVEFGKSSDELGKIESFLNRVSKRSKKV